ncbi:MAG TPA: type II toxin-antitoxin system RelE/ParE family toxin [Verrucomicrobiae bacterium]|nr:type II toxin-antitoxin system RelE/ParE family toxin [Verrucomicrobiae bacterium]
MESLADPGGHVLYLRERAGPQTALKFVDAVGKALARLENFPELGRTRHFHQKGLRSWGVPGFRNWILFYQPPCDGICLYRVLHGSMELESELGETEK